MSELIRLALWIGIAGAAATLVVAAAAFLMAEERRLGRAFRKVLGGPPDAVVIARGHGRAAGLDLAEGRIAVAWNAGGWCLLYDLSELMGAEVSLDGQVAARVFRSEPRRALERTSGAESEVRLRLVFDEPLHPDFELVLWPTGKSGIRSPAKPAEAVSEANRWLARIEAVMRRSGAAVVRPSPAHIPSSAARRAEDLFEEDEEEDLKETS